MKTEIFGTFGPACGQVEILVKMIDAGLTGMRLNLSHTSLQESSHYIEAYHQAAKSRGVKPQILIDMQGPELRIGKLQEEMDLKEGSSVCLVESKCRTEEGRKEAQEELVQIPVPIEVLRTLQAGDEVLLDDGKILLKIERVEIVERFKEEQLSKVAVAQGGVLRGGILRGSKSIKIKDKYVQMPPLTDHDRANIQSAKSYGVTALMQPFVCDGAELRQVRTILKEYNAKDLLIFAKIENLLGVQNIQDILPEADVIVIARGDLGNDMPLWELPAVQKHLEEACKEAGKPYIVVTQMLASMEKHPVPTRAEVSDIFYAVYHGAWGVMITGETAVGDYPVEAVTYLANTASEAERNQK